MDGGIYLSIFVTFILFALILLYFHTTNISTSRTLCPVGKCKTNILSGVKQCPDSKARILVTPSTEVCNSPSTCESNKTPFALKKDGSTNADGVCDEGDVCRCLQKPRCANHITSYFTAEKGTPSLGILPQRIVFNQVYSYTDISGKYNIKRPLEYINTLTDFCTIPNSWVSDDRIWPNNCVLGTLVSIPDEPDTFNKSKISITPMGCVIGNGDECPDKFPYWDKDKISCAS
ncbi:MAG: hypothetical protein COA94_02340 [Rickettsiales bacterium]|nr:MAG: hypothetical protein COA94_02340 [Rickettsiales bacterium]